MGKEISKRYVITLADKEEKVKGGGQEFMLRNLETAMLTNLFDIAASSQKSFRAANECLDCIGQIEGLGDDDTEIELTQQDLDYLKTAWEKTPDLQGGRPFVWNRCRRLMAQLENPPEKKAE